MIRKNSTNCKFNFSSHSSKSKFDSFMEKFEISRERCPSCHAVGQCRIFDYYERYIIDYYDGKNVSNIIRVSRAICSCGHTHAILPDFIIPYRQYSLPFVLHVLQIYFTHSMTLEKIFQTFGISHRILARWKAAFGKHKDLWLGIAKSKQSSLSAFMSQISDADPFSGFTMGFFQKTLLSFMQTHANPANCCHFPPGGTFTC